MFCKATLSLATLNSLIIVGLSSTESCIVWIKIKIKYKQRYWVNSLISRTLFFSLEEDLIKYKKSKVKLMILFNFMILSWMVKLFTQLERATQNT